MSHRDRVRDRVPIERGHGTRSQSQVDDRVRDTVGHGGTQSETKIEIDPEALRAEIAERIGSAIAEASRRKNERAEQRRQFAANRAIGKRVHHAQKLHTQQRKRR